MSKRTNRIGKQGLGIEIMVHVLTRLPLDLACATTRGKRHPWAVGLWRPERLNTTTYTLQVA